MNGALEYINANYPKGHSTKTLNIFVDTMPMLSIIKNESTSVIIISLLTYLKDNYSGCCYKTNFFNIMELIKHLNSNQRTNEYHNIAVEIGKKALTDKFITLKYKSEPWNIIVDDIFSDEGLLLDAISLLESRRQVRLSYEDSIGAIQAKNILNTNIVFTEDRNFEQINMDFIKLI